MKSLLRSLLLAAVVACGISGVAAPAGAAPLGGLAAETGKAQQLAAKGGIVEQVRHRRNWARLNWANRGWRWRRQHVWDDDRWDDDRWNDDWRWRRQWRLRHRVFRGEDDWSWRRQRIHRRWPRPGIVIIF